MRGRPVADGRSYAHGATSTTDQAPPLLPPGPTYRVQKLRPQLGQLTSHAEQVGVGREM